MKTPKHTKGPWTCDADLDDPVIYAPGAPYEPQIAVVSDGDPREETIANAHLISAAPEMLEALEGVVKNLNDDDWLEKVQAAIAKARGE